MLDISARACTLSSIHMLVHNGIRWMLVHGGWKAIYCQFNGMQNAGKHKAHLAAYAENKSGMMHEGVA